VQLHEHAADAVLPPPRRTAGRHWWTGVDALDALDLENLLLHFPDQGVDLLGGQIAAGAHADLANFGSVSEKNTMPLPYWP
jgi:hypothetical protein